MALSVLYEAVLVSSGFQFCSASIDKIGRLSTRPTKSSQHVARYSLRYLRHLPSSISPSLSSSIFPTSDHPSLGSFKWKIFIDTRVILTHTPLSVLFSLPANLVV